MRNERVSSTKKVILPTVQPIPGESLRYHVRSRSSQSVHLVDLMENGGAGKCGCEHHAFRVQPAIDRGESAKPCWHVEQALQRAGADFVRAVVEQAKMARRR